MTNKLTTIDEIKSNFTSTTLDSNNVANLEKYGFEDISMPEFPTPETPTEELTDCDRLLEEIFGIQQSKTNIKQFTQIQMQRIKKQAQLIWQNTINQLTQLKEMVTGAWQAVKKMVKDIADKIVEEYRIIIAYFKAEYAKIQNFFKKLKKAQTQEEKEKRLTQIKNEAKKYGGEVLEMLGIIELYNVLKDLWEVLKNIWGVVKNGWKSLIDNIKNLKILFKDNNTPLGKTILGWVVALLPLVAQLALSVLGAVKFAKEQQELNNKLTEDAIKNIEKPSNASNNSLLLEEALKTTKDFLDNKKIDVSINDTSCFSICPVEYNTNGVVDEEYVGFLIEIAKNVENYNFTTTEGTNIKNNDIIGYIETTPIKAKVEGVVKEIKNNYIIIEPNDTDENFNIECETSDDDIDNLISAFEEVGKIENILLNDILYIYKPILYNNFVKISAIDITLDNKFDNLIKEHEKNITNLGKDIKQITKKSNIEKKLNQENGLLQIKDDIILLKNKFFNNILKTFNDNNISLNAAMDIYKNGLGCNYELLEYYYDFILNFNYDKDNEYKVNLFNLILSFINERQEIEKFNKNEIISKFNKLSLEITTNTNLFETIKNDNGVIISNYIEKYNNENNLTNKEIEKTKEYIDEIYNYIKEKCEVPQIQNKEKEVDFQKLSQDEEYKKQFEAELNNEQSEEDNGEMSEDDKKILEKDKIAKKLAILYYIYISLENKKFIESENLLYKLKQQTNIEAKKILNYFDNISMKYKNAINITESKLKEIEQSLKEIDWGIPSELYIDNKKYTHYILKSTIKENKNNIEELEDIDSQISTKTAEEPSSYLYWLKYCGMASLLNCALPIYWGTGLVIAGAPVSLPIILIPIYVLNGSCICVFGLGICGIAIWPMILFSNLSTNMMSYLIPVNMVIDMIKTTLSTTKEKSKMSIKPLFTAPIATLDKQIKDTEQQIKDIKKEISLIKSM